MTSGPLWVQGMRVLPRPTRVVDAEGRQWAGYTLEQSKKLLELDDELYSLRLRENIWGGLEQGYKGQISLLREVMAKQEEKYDLLNHRFLDKSTLLDRTIEEKNQYKYRRSFALFGGRAGLLGSLLGIGLLALAVR